MKHFFITALISVAALAVRAQCSGCSPVNCSAQIPAGGLCDTIVTGMANQPMDEFVSFYMPKVVYNAQAPGGYVRLRRIKVTGVTGLPLGLTWESNRSPNNEYFPVSGDTLGCVNICGTALQAGSYPLVVYLEADVTVISLNIDVNNQSQTYNTATVIILPDTSGGVASFSISPNTTTSCDPLTLAFEGKIDGAPNPTTYNWDFGNGSTSTAKNPGSQTYTNAGTYPVRLETAIYNYVITEVRVFNVNNSYSGDIEELTTLQNPDLYFNIPVLGYTSTPPRLDSKTETWSGLSIEIPAGTTEFELRVWDDDNGPPFGSQDDSLARVTINVARGTFLWDDVNGTVSNGVIVMDTMLGNYFDETLDITIAPFSTADLFTVPSDSVCEGDTILLTLDGSDVFQYNWFKDSVFLGSATDTFIYLDSSIASGIYWAEVLNSVGCKTVSEQRALLVDPLPPVPVFYLNPPNDLLYTINAGGIAYVQWFLDGNPIVGATRAQYNAQDTGYYTVQYTNYVGCSAMSDPLHVTVITGVDELAQLISATVFPNPSNGNFTVQLQLQQPDDVEILLTDNVGKEIFHATEKATTLIYTHDFDFSALPAGVYFLKMMSANKQLTKKILLAE